MITPTINTKLIQLNPLQAELKYFLKAVKSDNTAIRENAQENLVRISRLLVSYLNQPMPLDGTKESDLLIQIAKEAPEQTVPVLINALEGSYNTYIKGNCAYILGHLGESAISSQKVLEHALHDDSSYVRKYALYGLREVIKAAKENRQVVNVSIAPKLIKALRDPNKSVHVLAACAIGHLGGKAVYPAVEDLLKFLGSENVSIPPVAAFALRKIAQEDPNGISRALHAAKTQLGLNGRKWADHTIQAVSERQ